MRAFIALLPFALAGSALAQSTLTETVDIVITSCGPEVSSCPGSTGATQLPTVASPSGAPVPSTNGTSSAGSPGTGAGTGAGAGSPAAGGSISVVTISTCVPTVLYSTVTLAPTTTPTPTSIPSAPSSKPVASSGTGAGNAPISPSITPFTGDASASSISMAVVGLAAAAAVYLA